jgi:TetR/AcrR family transcriptional regulator, repressor for uid operon
VTALPNAGAIAPSDATVDRILDAAMAQFVDFGIKRTTVDNVAMRAGLSRVTVYRRFARKSELVSAVILRELQAFLADFQAAIAKQPTIEDQLVEGFVLTLRAARTHPLITRILATEPETILPELTIRGGPFLRAAREFLAMSTGAPVGRLVAEDVDAVAEIFVRLVASFVLTPDGGVRLDDDARARAYARRHLAPLLGTIRAGSARKTRRG